MATKRGKHASDPLDDPVLRRTRVPDDAQWRLADVDPADTRCFPEREAAEDSTKADIEAIDQLQDLLYADAKRSLLVVFQAMDAGGKDGAIRKIFGPVDPLGMRAVSFKKPTGDELAHDFLWRVHRHAPGAGEIVVFNRSHYEDVLVPRVHGYLGEDQIERRYAHINAFEDLLADAGVVIVKFFLHISKAEQKERLQARLDDPAKRWKFRIGDLAERKRWSGYQEAYQEAIARCSTPRAPWYVVPADRKWHRTAVVARVLRRHLEALDLRYPEPEEDLDGVKVR